MAFNVLGFFLALGTFAWCQVAFARSRRKRIELASSEAVQIYSPISQAIFVDAVEDMRRISRRWAQAKSVGDEEGAKAAEAEMEARKQACRDSDKELLRLMRQAVDSLSC